MARTRRRLKGSRRGSFKRGGKGLVKHAGKVITVAHATKCVAKKFKGCSPAETRAVVKVIERMARAATRRR